MSGRKNCKEQEVEMLVSKETYDRFLKIVRMLTWIEDESYPTFDEGLSRIFDIVEPMVVAEYNRVVKYYYAMVDYFKRKGELRGGKRK